MINLLRLMVGYFCTFIQCLLGVRLLTADAPIDPLHVSRIGYLVMITGIITFLITIWADIDSRRLK